MPAGIWGDLALLQVGMLLVTEVAPKQAPRNLMRCGHGKQSGLLGEVSVEPLCQSARMFPLPEFSSDPPGRRLQWVTQRRVVNFYGPLHAGDLILASLFSSILEMLFHEGLQSPTSTMSSDSKFTEKQTLGTWVTLEPPLSLWPHLTPVFGLSHSFSCSLASHIL